MDSPLCCATCGALNPVPLEQFTYFELFGLEPRYDLDVKALHRKCLALSRAVHPDVAGVKPEESRQLRLSHTADLNRAYETLRDPVSRAEYLLSLAGGPSAGDDRSVPADLLTEVLALREEIDEARTSSDSEALHAMRHRIEQKHQAALELIAALSRKLDRNDEQAREELRCQLNAIKYWINLLDRIPVDDRNHRQTDTP